LLLVKITFGCEGFTEIVQLIYNIPVSNVSEVYFNFRVQLFNGDTVLQLQGIVTEQRHKATPVSVSKFIAP
jgi:hypothetical protein